MGHTHLLLEAEMGCSHLLSAMETASATPNDEYIIERFSCQQLWD